MTREERKQRMRKLRSELFGRINRSHVRDLPPARPQEEENPHESERIINLYTPK